MTKKRCPLGEDCDLTTAWMAGRKYTIDRYREEANPIIEAKDAEIERLRGAMQEAIRLAEQPHYGDRGDALDHCFDAIEVLRATLAELTGDKP